jgi:heme-degrading monooxygenase HmoA
MAYLIVHHHLEDYEKWKLVFDEHGAVRKEQGSKGAQVLRSAQDPNEVMVITEFESVEAARNFVGAPNLPEVMQRAGIVGKPDIHILEELERQPA